MKGNGWMERNMDKDNGSEYMGIAILENGNLERLMGKEFIDGLMEILMKEISEGAWNMEKAKKNLLMAMFILANIGMGDQKDKGSIFGMMGLIIKVILKTDWDMEKDFGRKK